MIQLRKICAQISLCCYHVRVSGLLPAHSLSSAGRSWSLQLHGAARNRHCSGIDEHFHGCQLHGSQRYHSIEYCWSILSKYVGVFNPFTVQYAMNLYTIVIVINSLCVCVCVCILWVARKLNMIHFNEAHLNRSTGRFC